MIESKKKDLIGVRKNNMVVLKQFKGQKIEVVCDCGLAFITERRSITDKNSRVTDCGCRMTGIVVGDKFGTWTVTGREDMESARGRLRASLVCECGRKDTLAFTALKNGRTPTCFCKRGLEYVGERHHMVTIISPTPKRANGAIVFTCKCDCGTVFETTRTNLLRANTTSCGCRQRTIAALRGKARMPKSEDWGYAYSHQKVAKKYGNASTHRCATVGCTNTASEWAYTHNDPDEVVSTKTHKGLAYSRNPEFYVALCLKCHNEFDNDYRKGIVRQILRPSYAPLKSVVQYKELEVRTETGKEGNHAKNS